MMPKEQKYNKIIFIFRNILYFIYKVDVTKCWYVFTEKNTNPGGIFNKNISPLLWQVNI